MSIKLKMDEGEKITKDGFKAGCAYISDQGNIFIVTDIGSIFRIDQDGHVIATSYNHLTTTKNFREVDLEISVKKS